jgi:hypothetical protein
MSGGLPSRRSTCNGSSPAALTRRESIIDVVCDAARHLTEGPQPLLLHRRELRLPENAVCSVKIAGALGHPPLQLLVQLAYGGFRALALCDFLLQFRVRDSQGRGARKLQGLRNDLHQKNRGWDRRQRGQRLDAAGQPIGWMPNHPDLHQVRPAAGHNEDCDADEHPVELQIFALVNEISERERDGKVSQCDQRVGDDVEPEHSRLPQIAQRLCLFAIRRNKIAASVPTELSSLEGPLHKGPKCRPVREKWASRFRSVGFACHRSVACLIVPNVIRFSFSIVLVFNDRMRQEV